MKPPHQNKTKIQAIKRKRQEFNLPESPPTLEQPKIRISQSDFFSTQASFFLQPQKSSKTTLSAYFSEDGINEIRNAKNRTTLQFGKNESKDGMSFTNSSKNSCIYSSSSLLDDKKEEQYQKPKLEKMLKDNLNTLLILYLKEQITKHHYKRLGKKQISSKLDEPELMPEQTEKCLKNSHFDPYRQRDPEEIDLFMDYVELQLLIEKQQKKLKSIYKMDPVKTMAHYFTFETEKNAFSRKLFMFEMFGGEKKSHLSRFNRLKVEIFWLKILQKGGRKEYLNWLSSGEKN